jgi:hypothetical protein
MGVATLTEYSRRNIFFYLAYTIWAIVAFTNTTYISVEIINFRPLFYCVPILLLLQEIFRENTVKNQSYLLLIVLFSLCFAIYEAGGIVPISISILLYGSRDADFKKIIKITLYVVFICLIITIFLSLTGIITNEIGYKENTSLIRYSLGFTGRTYASYNIVVLSALCVALYNKKLPNSIILLLIILNVFIYIQTRTRNGMLIVFLIITVGILNKLSFLNKIFNFIKKRIYLKFICMNIYIICAIIMFSLTFMFKFDMIGTEFINKILSYRLSFASEAISQFGIPIFGTPISWETLSYIVDSSYIRTCFDYGLVVLILYLVATVKVLGILFKKEEFLLIFIIFIYAIHVSFDPDMLVLYLNPFTFLMVNKEFLAECDDKSKCVCKKLLKERLS